MSSAFCWGWTQCSTVLHSSGVQCAVLYCSITVLYISGVQCTVLHSRSERGRFDFPVPVYMYTREGQVWLSCPCIHIRCTVQCTVVYIQTLHSCTMHGVQYILQYSVQYCTAEFPYRTAWSFFLESGIYLSRHGADYLSLPLAWNMDPILAVWHYLTMSKTLCLINVQHNYQQN